MLDVAAIESFFDARFQVCDESLSEAQSLRHFDGFLHWELLWLPSDGLLRFAADRDPWATAYPALEVGGRFASASILQLTGGGTALVLVPNGNPSTNNYLVITRTKEGRLSFSTTLGDARA